MAKEVTVIAECKDCNGTGLYIGWNCHDGAASTCDSCKGTGSVTIKYTPFTGKKEKKGITRVFSNVRWRHVYPEKHRFDDGKVIDFSEYGCTYEEWKDGVTPRPIPE